MSQKGWLPITEYAGKYRVSISTLRRRIKAGEIEHSFSDGKYLLRDAPLGKASNPLTQSAQPVTTAPPHKASGQPAASETPKLNSQDEESSPILATANRLLNELKKAYSVILQEKEEQLLQLKDEVSDLKTLVRVLESENERLSKAQPSVENWLD